MERRGDNVNEFLMVDGQRFTHETVDGETMIIDTLNGRLLLLGGIGPALWDGLCAGVRLADLLEQIRRRFGDAAGDAVAGLLGALTQAEVFLAGLEAPASGESLPLAWLAAAQTYAPPTLEQYDDISEIINMDPIHDVGPDAGWPRLPEF